MSAVSLQVKPIQPSNHSGITKRDIQHFIRERKWDELKMALRYADLDQPSLFALVSGELAHLDDANLFSLALEKVDSSFICTHFLDYCRLLQFLGSSDVSLFRLAVDRLKGVKQFPFKELLEDPAYEALLEKLVELQDLERLSVMISPLDESKPKQMEMASRLLAKAIDLENANMVRTLYKNRCILTLDAMRARADALPSFFGKEMRMYMMATYLKAGHYNEELDRQKLLEYAAKEGIDCSFILEYKGRDSYCHLFFALPFTDEQLTILIRRGGMDFRPTVRWLQKAALTLDLQRIQLVIDTLRQRKEPMNRDNKEAMQRFLRKQESNPRFQLLDQPSLEKWLSIRNLLSSYFFRA